MSALDVNLTVAISGGSTTVYSLQVEEFTVNIRRSPIHAAMPGANPLQIDMGFYDPSVTIRGVLPTTNGSDGTNAIPSKNTLEDIVTNRFGADVITLSIPGTSGDASGGTDYVGKIASCNFTLMPGKESIYWQYRMTLLAEKRS